MIESIKVKNKSGKIVTGRQITVTSIFPSSMDNVWNEILKFNTLRYICRPKAYFVSCNKKSFVWRKDETYHFRLYIYGVIPMGIHKITVEKMDRDTRELLTAECNKIVTVWNHYIKMKKTVNEKTQYMDRVDLYAGILSPVFAWWTERFYKHRQRRWIKMLNKNNTQS
ncbi:MAG: hypothetical protein LUH22_07795 [Bacteroides sp.]|nr:hypothetical protein [Bacteroides sp.]